MEQSPNKSKHIIGVIGKIVGVVVGFIVAFAITRYLVYVIFTINNDAQNDTYSTAELINENVKQIKAGITFPNKLDAATTWVDTTAEPNAIRYHYVLSDIDTSSLSNDYLKNYLGSSICQNKIQKKLLEQGVNMEYSYLVENTTQSYFVFFTKADCLQ